MQHSRFIGLILIGGMATAMTAAGCQGASAVDQARKPAEAVEVRPVETTRPERREFVDRVVTQGST